MDDERHFLWGKVGQTYAELKGHAPPGYEPVVEVFLQGRHAPVVSGPVETRRDKPWVMIHSLTIGKDDPDNTYPSDAYVFVHESQVLRVEIHYQAGLSVGDFAYNPNAPTDDE